MNTSRTFRRLPLLRVLLFVGFGCFFHPCFAQGNKPPFHVLAFFTGRADQAHISFTHDANRYFPEAGKKYGFTYDSTKDWTRMNRKELSKYQVILFLDTRPDSPDQRKAFQEYMQQGGAWMGFHFSAFALTPSDYPMDWDWYHKSFLGSESYVSNTWRPTSALLKVDDPAHPATRGLPHTFKTAPNEWYRWSGDLRHNPDIEVLLSIDSASFPLGTGPKPYEIWHSGDYPVAWTNKKFRMIYMNMGHNDIDYEHGTNKDLSHTFDSGDETRFILNSLIWLGRK